MPRDAQSISEKPRAPVNLRRGQQLNFRYQLAKDDHKRRPTSRDRLQSKDQNGEARPGEPGTTPHAVRAAATTPESGRQTVPGPVGGPWVGVQAENKQEKCRYIKSEENAIAEHSIATNERLITILRQQSPSQERARCQVYEDVEECAAD